jgi:hypothetical protein
MKPFSFTYSCPHCKMSLQSPNTGSGQTVSCPGCEKQFVVPPPPPRPLGGWLLVFGIWLVVALTVFLVMLVAYPVSFLLSPYTTPTIVLTYGFFKQRKWFTPCVMFSQVYNSLSSLAVFSLRGPNSDPDLALLSLVFAQVYSALCLIYFWRSRRVKETFTT